MTDPTQHADAIFVADGDLMIPTPKAASAWGPEVLHGGPTAALVARAAERALSPATDSAAERALSPATNSAAERALFPATARAAERALSPATDSAAERALSPATDSSSPDPALLPSRLTVDLFRSVPLTPLSTEVEIVRQGRRVVVARVSVIADGLEVARGQVLFLRRTEGPATNPIAPPPGPNGLEAAIGLNRGAPLPPGRGGGFHTLVETRWPADEDAPRGSAVWVRLPFPVVLGEEPTPFQRLAAVSDFGNALANFAADWQDQEQRRLASFINTDISVHLLRPPQGEWLALVADRAAHTNGVGLVEVTHYDHLGHYARGTQARLANPR